MKKTPTIEPKKPDPGTGTARCLDENGKLRMPPPYVEKNSPAQIAAEAVPLDDLPQDFKAALALQAEINNLPGNTKGKQQRLQRIGRHVHDLQRGPVPPSQTFEDLWCQFFGRRPTEADIVNARASLL